jgi:hypothetical protein
VTNGATVFQGLPAEIYQNPSNSAYGATIDVQKVANLFGPHTFSIGLGYNRAIYIYKVAKDYVGGRFSFPAANADGVPIQQVGGSDALVGTPTRCNLFPHLGSCRLPIVSVPAL